MHAARAAVLLLLGALAIAVVSAAAVAEDPARWNVNEVVTRLEADEGVWIRPYLDRIRDQAIHGSMLLLLDEDELRDELLVSSSDLASFAGVLARLRAQHDAAVRAAAEARAAAAAPPPPDADVDVKVTDDASLASVIGDGNIWSWYKANRRMAWATSICVTQNPRVFMTYLYLFERDTMFYPVATLLGWSPIMMFLFIAIMPFALTGRLALALYPVHPWLCVSYMVAALAGMAMDFTQFKGKTARSAVVGMVKGVFWSLLWVGGWYWIWPLLPWFVCDWVFNFTVWLHPFYALVLIVGIGPVLAVCARIALWWFKDRIAAVAEAVQQAEAQAAAEQEADPARAAAEEAEDMWQRSIKHD